MDSRDELHEIFVNILGSRNVYFQPPESKKIMYPCIIYKRTKPSVKFANNISYINKKCYSVTVVDANPDSKIPDAIEALTYCSFDRHFTSNNLNHYIYNLYF